MVERFALDEKVRVRVAVPEPFKPSLWDTKIVSCDKGVCIHTYHGKGVGWTATKFFWTEKEAQEWLKGGIKSTPDPKRTKLPRT